MKPHLKLKLDGSIVEAQRLGTKRSIADFLAELKAQNKTLAEWTRGTQFSLQMVYCTVFGKSLGRRGQAREILIAIGVEPPPMYAPRKPPGTRYSGTRADAARAA